MAKAVRSKARTGGKVPKTPKVPQAAKARSTRAAKPTSAAASPRRAAAAAPVKKGSERETKRAQTRTEAEGPDAKSVAAQLPPTADTTAANAHLLSKQTASIVGPAHHHRTGLHGKIDDLPHTHQELEARKLK